MLWSHISLFVEQQYRRYLKDPNKGQTGFVSLAYAHLLLIQEKRLSDQQNISIVCVKS